MLNVGDLNKAMQRFSWPDYAVFGLMLASCMGIGVYFAWQDHQRKKKQKKARRGSEALAYLVGGRKMSVFPVAMSLVASLISGIGYVLVRSLRHDPNRAIARCKSSSNLLSFKLSRHLSELLLLKCHIYLGYWALLPRFICLESITPGFH